VEVLAAMLDDVPEAIVTTDLEYRVTSWNRAASALYGVAFEDAVGRLLDTLYAFGAEPVPREEVRAIVRRTPQTAQRILKRVEFPWPVAEAIGQHQERLDGSGYPAGLQGEEILREARILAVADTVEAMLTHRPYRPAHPLPTVLAEIERQRGRQLDAEIVDACLLPFREKGFSFEPI